MKFRLYRPKHLKIEGNGLVQGLRSLLSKPKAWAAGVALVGAISAFSPVKAMAAGNQAVDTTTPVTQEQVVDSGVTQSNDAVSQAVEQTQAVTTTEVSNSASEVSTSAPATTVSAPVQEQVAPVQETAAPSVNAEIDSRVPQVETQAEETQTAPEVTKAETTSDVTTDASQSETEVVSEEEAEQVTDVTTAETSDAEDTKEETIDYDQQSDNMGIVSENPIILDQDTSSVDVDQTTETTETTDTETTSSEQTEEKEESVEVTSPETEVDENTNTDYQVISQDGNLTIVGNIPEDQLSQVIEDLTNQYGEEAVSGLTIFDYDTINSQVDYGETVQLGNSGYTAIKHEDGSIEVRDANSNVIASWQGQEMDIEDNQEITAGENQEIDQNEEGPTFAEDLTVPEDYAHRDYEVNTDEYLVIENADGSYTIAMGGVGLSGNQLQDLISKLQSEGVIPADAQVVPGVLPSAPTDEMKEQGKTEQLAQVGDYIISTTDGINYTVYSKDGTALDTILK